MSLWPQLWPGGGSLPPPGVLCGRQKCPSFPRICVRTRGCLRVHSVKVVRSSGSVWEVCGRESWENDSKRNRVELRGGNCEKIWTRLVHRLSPRHTEQCAELTSSTDAVIRGLQPNNAGFLRAFTKRKVRNKTTSASKMVSGAPNMEKLCWCA